MSFSFFPEILRLSQHYRKSWNNSRPWSDFTAHPSSVTSFIFHLCLVVILFLTPYSSFPFSCPPEPGSALEHEGPTRLSWDLSISKTFLGTLRGHRCVRKVQGLQCFLRTRCAVPFFLRRRTTEGLGEGGGYWVENKWSQVGENFMIGT